MKRKGRKYKWWRHAGTARRGLTLSPVLGERGLVSGALVDRQLDDLQQSNDNKQR